MYSQPAAHAHAHHHAQWRPPTTAYPTAPTSAPIMHSFHTIWRPDAAAAQPKPPQQQQQQQASQSQTQQQPPQSAPPSGTSSSYVYVGAGNGYPAPPPVPQGVNPQTWMQGRWRYQQPAPSTTYGPTLPPPSAVGWNVHSGWGVPAAQTYYPPQRRPDPSYWQTELTDNGLGLENMHIRQDPKKDAGGAGGKAPHTPWTWVPRELAAEDSPQPQSQASQSRQSNGERRYTTDSASRSAQSQPQSQSQAGPPPPYYPGMSSQQRQPQTSSASAQARQSSSTASAQPSPSYGSQMPSSQSHVRQPSSSSARPVQRSQTMPADIPAPTPQRAQHGHTASGQHESFSEVKALRTTFSPAIIRTPTHYRNVSRGGIYQDPASSAGPMSASANANGVASASANSFSSASSTSSSSSASSAATARPVTRAHTVPSQAAAGPAVNSQPPPSRALGRHATAPTISTSLSYRDRERDRDGPLNNAISSLSHFAEEPEGMLSPLLEVSPIPDTRGREPQTQSQAQQEGRFNPYASRQPSQPPPHPQPQVQTQSIQSQAQGHRSAPSRSPTYPFQQQPQPQSQPYPQTQPQPQAFYADSSPHSQPRSNRNSTGVSTSTSASASTSPHSYPTTTTHSTPSSTRTRSSGTGSLQPSPHHSVHYGSAGEQIGMVPYGGVSPLHAQGQSQAQGYGSRERTRENGRERERDRDRDRERDWDRHQRHHREREREHDRDRERSSRHSHSRAPSRSHHSSATSTPASTTSSSSASSMNPLPIPPRDIYNAPDAALARVLPPPPQRTPPPGTYRSRVRWGFWNRRGDYLTPDMRVVYAPPDRANPADLKKYPAATEGYMDHNNNFVQYDAARPEAEESRPSKGRAPVAPYDRFVTYVYK